MVNPPEAQGGLDVCLVVNQVQNGLGHGGGDARSAWRSQHPSDGRGGGGPRKDQSGAHGGEGGLAWLDGVGLGAHDAIGVRDARGDGEIIHFIIPHDAGVAGDHPGSPAGVDGGGHGDRVAVLVQHGEMRGVPAGGLWAEDVGVEPRRDLGALGGGNGRRGGGGGGDDFGDEAGPVFGEQVGEQSVKIGDKERISQEGAVGKSSFRGFDI